MGIKRKKVLLSRQKPKDYNLQKPAHLKTLANLYENTIHHNSDNTVYLDEVTFSAKTLQNRAWAEPGDNITQSVFIKSEPCVAILAAATVQRGLFLFHWR